LKLTFYGRGLITPCRFIKMSISITTIYDRITGMTQRSDLEQSSGIFSTALEETVQEISRRHGLTKYNTTHTLLASEQLNSLDDVFAINPFSTLSFPFLTCDYVMYDDEVMDRLTIEEVLAGQYGYCEYDKKLYIGDVKAGEDVIIYYTAEHVTPLITVSLPDSYQSAVIYLTAAKVYEYYEILDKAQYYRQLYEREMFINGREKSTPAVCKARR
jgi:hypothetical protein